MASQMGRKRAATSALATTCAERPIVAASATGSLPPGELTDRTIRSGRTMKSKPRPGVHSAHFELEVSTVTERIASEVAFRAPALNKLEPALTGCHHGESQVLGG